jgi:hypothetical protein
VHVSGTGGTAVGDTNVTLDRVNIHGCENGFDADQWVTVQNSWIHDLLGGVGHTDGLQMAHYLNGCATSACEVSHARFVDVIHNRIEAIDGTSAIISNPSGDSDVTIRNNLLTGGAYTLYCPYNGVAGAELVRPGQPVHPHRRSAQRRRVRPVDRLRGRGAGQRDRQRLGRQQRTAELIGTSPGALVA